VNFFLALLAIGSGTIGFVLGIVAYRIALPWAIARSPSPTRFLLPIIEEARWYAAHRRRPRLGSQHGRHLATRRTMPQEPPEGPQEPGTAPGPSPLDLTTLQPTAAPHARRIGR
jgi:hypothetical protein